MLLSALRAAILRCSKIQEEFADRGGEYEHAVALTLVQDLVITMAGVGIDCEDGNVRCEVEHVCFFDKEGAWTGSAFIHVIGEKVSTCCEEGKYASENFHDMHACVEGVSHPLHHLRILDCSVSLLGKGYPDIPLE